MGLEDTMEHMLWVGEGVITKNRVRTIKSIMKAFDKIKIADIKRVAKEILQTKHYNLAVVGPITVQQEKQLNKLLEV